MNTKIISAICITLAICLAIYFYAEWQKAKFDAALPSPLPVEEQAGGHWHGAEWHADGTHADDKLIPSVDWEPNTGRPHEAAKPDGLDALDADDPVAKAWEKLDEIADNPFAWGGNADPRTVGLVQQLMPPITYFESEAHAEEILGLLAELADLRDPRGIETLVTNMCEGPGLSRTVIEGLVALGPPVVPHLIPYLDEESDNAMGVFIAAHVLGPVGAQHRDDLGGIIEHIVLPKFKWMLAEKSLSYPMEVSVKETITRLKK